MEFEIHCDLFDIYLPVLSKFEDLMVFPFLKGRILRAQIIRHATEILLAHANMIRIGRAICQGLCLIPDWIVKRVQVVGRNKDR